jgi:hypothetical protein
MKFDPLYKKQNKEPLGFAVMLEMNMSEINMMCNIKYLDNL